MKTIELKLYKFDELSGEAKRVAVDQEYSNEDYLSHDWWSSTYEDAKTVFLKITESSVYPRYCKGEFMKDAEATAMAIFENHGVDCETYKLADEWRKKNELIPSEVKTEDEQDMEDERTEMHEQNDEAFLDALLGEYANMLEKEYDYLMSDEAIAEHLSANDYDFTEDGKIYF